MTYEERIALCKDMIKQSKRHIEWLKESQFSISLGNSRVYPGKNTLDLISREEKNIQIQKEIMARTIKKMEEADN